MTRYALILSDDRHLFERLRAAVEQDDRFDVVDDLVHCDGTAAPLTNIYPSPRPQPTGTAGQMRLRSRTRRR